MMSDGGMAAALDKLGAGLAAARLIAASGGGPTSLISAGIHKASVMGMMMMEEGVDGLGLR